MIIRKSLTTIIVTLTVVVSYYLLTGMLEWLRIKAGVGSDTLSPIDFAAWQSCTFASAVIGGVLSGRVLRCAGPVGIIGVLVGIGICLAVQLDDRCEGSLQMDVFWGVSGTLAIPVLTWIVATGFAVGWAMNADQKSNRDAWIALSVLIGALVALFVVFYPLDKYFVSIWGSG